MILIIGKSHKIGEKPQVVYFCGLFVILRLQIISNVHFKL